MAAKLELATLNSMDTAQFVDALGSIYEKSAWVAERAHARAPFASLTALADAMAAAVAAAPDAEKLALLRAHPDLAGKAALAGDVTRESSAEQARAGLGALTAAELERFTTLNAAYKAKFEFPFILAVRNATKRTILAAFERRLESTRDAEVRARAPRSRRRARREGRERRARACRRRR